MIEMQLEEVNKLRESRSGFKDEVNWFNSIASTRKRTIVANHSALLLLGETDLEGVRVITPESKAVIEAQGECSSNSRKTK